MGITVYSVVSSVLFFNIALIAAFIMRRSSVFLAKRTVSFLILTVLLGIVRLFFPIDFDRNYVIRSYHVIPAIEDFLDRPVAGSISVGSLLLGIWIVGTLVFLTRDLIRQLRFLREIRHFPSVDRLDLIELASEFGSSFSLLVSPEISRPYVAGLLHPVIYLPDLELSEEQWRIILRHEVQHIRSLDGWKKLFFLVIQALFWWNPLAHVSLSEIDTLIELQCDAKVTADMNAEEVDCYLETLKSLKVQSTASAVPVGASTLVWDQKQLVARFRALQDAGFSKKKRPHVLAYTLLFAVFVASYFVIVQPVIVPSEADYWDDGSVPEDTYLLPFSLEAPSEYILHENGKYYYYLDDQYIGPVDKGSLTDEVFASVPIIEVNK